MNKQRRMTILRGTFWKYAAGVLSVMGASHAGTSSYREAVLADGPIVYYEFDETSGTIATNSGSTGVVNNGSISTAGGTVTVNQGSFTNGGTAYDFGGGFVGATAGLANSLDEWTVEAWVNYDSAKTSASHFLSNDQGGWNDDVLFGIGAENGSVGVLGGNVGVVQQGSPGSTRDFTGAPLSAGQWHHVVLSGSASEGSLRLSIDGVAAGTPDSSLVNGATFNGADGIGRAHLTIGAARPNPGDAGYRPYDGLLDELAIYDKVLDAETIARHYTASGEIPPDPPDSPDPPSTEGFGLAVSEYAPDSDLAQFRWPTHIAFGPGKQEIISDLKNNRFVYRDSPGDPLQVSPVSLSGQHSVVYNPEDGLYYANDTGNHRIIAFADLSSGTIAAQTNTIAGVALDRPHDILIDPATGWIYALNPNSGHVFRFTAIGENESAISVPVGGYARALTFANGKLYAIGSAKGRIVEIVDWDTPTFKIHDSFDPTGRGGSAGSWSKTGLVLNDAEFFNGFWYATSYFTASYADGTDFDENKFIRFATMNDLVAGDWTDLSSLVPSGMTPYFLTVNGDKLHLAIFNHESPGNGDAILQLSPIPDSTCAIIGSEHDPLAGTTSLTWESVVGEVFEVQKSLDLDSWLVIKTQIPAAAAPLKKTTDLVDLNAFEQRAFYKVGLSTGDGE